MQYFGTGRFDGTLQSVAYTGTAGQITNGISTGVSKVRIWCSTAAFVKQHRTSLATTADVPVGAEAPEYVTCSPGDKFSAIQSASGGTLYVLEIP